MRNVEKFQQQYSMKKFFQIRTVATNTNKCEGKLEPYKKIETEMHK